MKFATVSKSLMMGLALLLASSAFATTKGTLTISDPVTVSGTTLKAGEYRLEWEGSGPSVEVSIMQGKHVIAKVPAKVVPLNQAPANDSAELQKHQDGSATLSAARFAGKKFALELGDASDQMQAGSSK